MKAMLVDGSFSGDILSQKVLGMARIQLGARGVDVDEIVLREKAMHDCIGCFGCWVKTPGLCIFDDFGREYARMEMETDVVVAITPVTYGGYSSLLKRAMDRQICVLLPYMKSRDGETHHPLRYRYYPKLLVIGTLAGPSDGLERTFSKLVARNGINGNTKADSLLITSEKDDGSIKEGISALLTRSEVMG
jgi:multimeric flavodoxin WrbA